MRIGELARRTGVSERSLRYYEEQGLLRPRRLQSGYRVYQESDVDTVRHVQTLLAAGLGTKIIAEVLPCMVDIGEGLVPLCADLVEGLRTERERITATIEELTAARSLLDEVITAAPADDSEYEAWLAAHSPSVAQRG